MVDRFREEIPVFEEINFLVAVQNIGNEKSFTYAPRLLLNLDWVGTNVLFSNFGADAALTNGIQFRYNDKDLLPTPITTLNSLFDIAYDVSIVQDDTAPKINHLVSRFSFFKFMPNGLRLDGKNKFEVVVLDDLSGSSNTEGNILLQGYVLGKKREKR